MNHKILKENNLHPLVSIIVITYNSSKFVLETLESAKKQTYKNIELIISDDCSTDKTIELCKIWLVKNKRRFVRTEIITTAKNSGISTNCNLGLNKAKGVWIKFIAGDDILLEDCIKDFIDYCFLNPLSKVVFGQVNFLNNGKIKPRKKSKLEITGPKDQKYMVFSGSFPMAPALFMNKKTLKSVGGFDENYKFIEDLPLYINFLNNDIRFNFMNSYVVNYRIHDSNVSNNPNFMKDFEKVVNKKIFPYLLNNNHFGVYFHYKNYFFVEWFKSQFGIQNIWLDKILNLFVIRTTIRRLMSKQN